MALSSNSLFHFTNKKALYGILKERFRIKYCFETIHTHTTPFQFGIPMVSFCDIPLSEVQDHMGKYGSYGIGFKKSWAQTKGLNPVLYIDPNSSLIQSFHHVYHHLLTNKFALDLDETQKSVLNILRYFKNYQADLIRKNGVTTKNYKFANEREWRYLPDGNEIQMVINRKNYERIEELTDLNETLRSLRLAFDLKDISFIILNDETEVNEIIKHLRKVFTPINDDDLESIISKIITKEQIFEDF